MNEPKKIYLSDPAISLLEIGMSCNAYPNKTESLNHVYHSDTALREFIEENQQERFGVYKIIELDELLKFLNEQ